MSIIKEMGVGVCVQFPCEDSRCRFNTINKDGFSPSLLAVIQPEKSILLKY